MKDSAQTNELPELMAPAAALLMVGMMLQLTLLGPGNQGEYNSAIVTQIVMLGFAPWLYFGYAAGRLFKLAGSWSGAAATQSKDYIWAEAACMTATVFSEIFISWCLIYWSGMQKPVPFPHQLVVLSFLVPFALGAPASFTFAIRLANRLGARREGVMAGLLICVGLLHPFTLLGAQMSLLVLLCGPRILNSYGAGQAWIYSAAIGFAVAMLGLSKLDQALKMKHTQLPVIADK